MNRLVVTVHNPNEDSIYLGSPTAQNRVSVPYLNNTITHENLIDADLDVVTRQEAQIALQDMTPFSSSHNPTIDQTQRFTFTIGNAERTYEQLQEIIRTGVDRFVQRSAANASRNQLPNHGRSLNINPNHNPRPHPPTPNAWTTYVYQSRVNGTGQRSISLFSTFPSRVNNPGRLCPSGTHLGSTQTTLMSGQNHLLVLCRD